MKTYFNRPDTNVYIMIDDEQNKVIFLNNASYTKNLIVITEPTAYSNFVLESTDVTKWITSNETDFNNVKDVVISSI